MTYSLCRKRKLADSFIPCVAFNQRKQVIDIAFLASLTFSGLAVFVTMHRQARQKASSIEFLFFRDTMKECANKVTRQYDSCFKTYNKLSTVEDLPSICQRTVTSPSIADMLEWLQTSEMLLRQQYLCKQQLVRTFNISDKSSTEIFVKEWAIGDKELIDEIEGL